MPPIHNPNQNRLLAALPTLEYERIGRHLELVPLALGAVLYEPASQMDHAYFPTTAIASLHYVNESGESAEMAGVGNEGVVGVALFLGGDTTSSSAVVHTAGHAYRLERGLLKREFELRGPTCTTLLRYTQELVAQIAQAAACNRHHSVEQQLSRWLLATLDRVPSGELIMTQQLIASLLGVRREGITEAAGQLQLAGFIRYRRGQISVVDRPGLETRSCECYAALKKELHRLRADVQYRGRVQRSAEHPVS